MGKYMRKGKGVEEVAVMEVVATPGVSSLGVRTRARTRTLAQKSEHKQRLVTRSAGSSKQPQKCMGSSSQHQSHASCYLELRSRKLEKILPRCSCYRNHSDQNLVANSARGATPTKDEVTLPASISSVEPRQQNPQSSVAHSRNNSATLSSQVQSNAKPSRAQTQDNQHQMPEQFAVEALGDNGVEVSFFGENIMDPDCKERKTRETTPSSYLKEIDTAETPGSTTRPPPPTTRRRLQQQQMEIRRQQEIANRNIHFPSSNEIDEFFAGAEQQEQRRFTERYNYDPVSDSPLSGRYEWIRLRP